MELPQGVGPGAGRALTPWGRGGGPGFILLLLACAAAFAPALAGGYVYDDFRFIADNPFMEAPAPVTAVFTDPETMEDRPTRDIYRPLRTLLFQFEHRLGKGSPRVHHLAGILFHLVNTALAFLLIRTIVGRNEPAALVGAGLFALHPVQVESVAWITSRGDQLVALFVLLALLNALRPGGGWFRQALAPALAFLACLSKESGAITGGLILLAALLTAPQRRRTLILHGVLALAAVVPYLYLRGQVLGGLSGQVAPHGGSTLTNVLYACFGLAYLTSLIFRPWFSNVDYDGLFDRLPLPAVAAVGLAYLVLLFGAVFFYRRKPVPIFAVLFFVMALLPTSSLLFPLRSLVNDRYLYLAMAGAGLFLAWSAQGLTNRWTAWKGRILTAFAVLLGVLGFLTGIRCMDWKNQETLWAATLETNEGSVKARLSLAFVRFDRGDIDGALSLTEDAIAHARPGSWLSADAFHLAAKVLTRKGDRERAAEVLRSGLAQADAGGNGRLFRHRIQEMAQNLWYFDFKAGRYEKALEDTVILLKYEGETQVNLYLKGHTLRFLGRGDEAEAVLRKGADMEGDCPEIHQALFELYKAAGRPAEAIKAFNTWQRLKTKSPDS